MLALTGDWTGAGRSMTHPERGRGGAVPGFAIPGSGGMDLVRGMERDEGAQEAPANCGGEPLTDGRGARSLSYGSRPSDGVLHAARPGSPILLLWLHRGKVMQKSVFNCVYSVLKNDPCCTVSAVTYATPQ